MKTANKVIVVLVIMATLLAVGCTGSSSEYSDGNVDENADSKYGDGNTDENTDTKAPETEPLEILDHQLEKGEYGSYTVVGSAKAHKSFSYAEVKVKFYDEDGALIETFLDNVNDLEEGETWSFEVMCPVFDKEVADYKIAAGSCW